MSLPKTLFTMLLSISFLAILGCKSGGDGGGYHGGWNGYNSGLPRLYDPIVDRDKIIELRDKVLQDSSFISTQNISSISLEHYIFTSTVKQCGFLGIKKLKSTCEKTVPSKLRRRWTYNRGRGTSLSGHFMNTSIKNDTSTQYRTRIKTLLNQSLSRNNIKIEQILLTSLSNHVSILSSLVGGSGARGSAFKVTLEKEDGASIAGAQWENIETVLVFSFDLPLEANPIYKGDSERDAHDETSFRYSEVFLNGTFSVRP